MFSLITDKRPQWRLSHDLTTPVRGVLSSDCDELSNSHEEDTHTHTHTHTGEAKSGRSEALCGGGLEEELPYQEPVLLSALDKQT